MTSRHVFEETAFKNYTLTYNAENRLVEVTKNGATIAQFTCDGDGKRVKSVINGETTLFVGNYFEQKGSQATKYYFAGTTRIAMRKYVIPQNMTVEYLISTGSIQRLGDHPSASLRASLGSTSLTTDADGAKVSEMRYKPWGEVRYTWTASLSTTPAYKLANYTFTGQYSYMDDPSTAGVTEGFGLMFYNARWYDPVTGRFAQADTIVPGGVQGLDRYAYVNNMPTRFTDPSGHRVTCDVDEDCKLSQQLSHLKGKSYWKAAIKGDFGVKIVDDKVKWSERNLITAYDALSSINIILNGKLKTMVGGTTFTMTDGGNQYYGITNSTGVTFHVANPNVNIPLINFLHETGHLIDAVPATLNAFSGQIPENPTWIKDGYVDSEILGKKIQ